jgi:hypothetical protein
MKRWAHVYLPSSYDGSKTFPLWVHLHGVFWNTMDNISGKVSESRCLLQPAISVLNSKQ